MTVQELRDREDMRLNGFGAGFDPEYERESRMDDMDSLTIVEAPEISIETLDRVQSRINELLSSLQEKEEKHLPITKEDVSHEDVQVAMHVVEVRDTLVEKRKEHDPQFVKHVHLWINAESFTSEYREDIDTLVAKIDAADRMLIELEEDEEEAALKDVTLDIKLDLVAKLSAKQLAKYYALAA